MTPLQFPAEVRRDPFPFYAQLRAHSPVVQQGSVWALFDYDGVKRALTDSEAFSSAASPKGSAPASWLIFTDPPRHSKLRALIGRAFTPRTVANLEPRIRALSRELLEPILSRGETDDFVSAFASPLPLMVIAELLGADPAGWRRFRGWSEAILGLVETVHGDAAREREAYAQAHEEMREEVEGLLEARRSHPQDDLLTNLLQAEVEGARLSSEELLGFFELLLLAGNETTTNLIDNAVLSLAQDAQAIERLREDAGSVPLALEEVLRHRAPVQAAFRIARQDVELHGQTIPTGALVLAVIGSANRDEKHFPDADRFDPARAPNPHLAFGHGIHFCIGAALARLEGRVALSELLLRVRGFEVDADWEPRTAFHVHGPARLPVRFLRG